MKQGKGILPFLLPMSWQEFLESAWMNYLSPYILLRIVVKDETFTFYLE